MRTLLKLKKSQQKMPKYKHREDKNGKNRKENKKYVIHNENIKNVYKIIIWKERREWGRTYG